MLLKAFSVSTPSYICVVWRLYPHRCDLSSHLSRCSFSEKASNGVFVWMLTSLILNFILFIIENCVTFLSFSIKSSFLLVYIVIYLLLVILSNLFGRHFSIQYPHIEAHSKLIITVNITWIFFCCSPSFFFRFCSLLSIFFFFHGLFLSYHFLLVI